MKIHYKLTIFFAVFTFSGFAANVWKLTSPDNKLELKLENLQDEQTQKSKLYYSVQLRNETEYLQVVELSRLGLTRNDQQFEENLQYLTSNIEHKSDHYILTAGRKLENSNEYNQMIISFKNPSSKIIQLELRAYNNGIAFRYVFPEKSVKTVTVKNEATEFNLPDQGNAWIQPYDVPSQWTPGYEKYYENKIPIGTFSPNTEGWAFPALFETNSCWVLVSESNLTASYCGCRLEQKAQAGIYKIRFPEPKDGEGFGKVQPESKLPWTMPWRTIAVSRDLAGIFSSTLINDVADSSDASDYSWVKPGKASWSWLTENDSPKSYESLKKYVDLANKMGWEYSLVDANWDLMQGGDIKQLVDYASSKNVGIWMWYNSGGKNNTVTERPRNIISDPKKCEQEFKKLQQWGVKGVKIDFWQSDKQNMIVQYLSVLKLAAQYHIMVNLHGCTISRGWHRTFPNLVTLEAVKGEEAYLFDSQYPEKAPIQNTILPFTRNVLGGMDYTPVCFTNLKYPHKSTSCHELALTLIHNSGMLHFADNPESYDRLPDFVKEFMSAVPVAFDETVLLNGYPGESAIIAARKGDKWYLAGINGTSKPIELKFSVAKLLKLPMTLRLIEDRFDDFQLARIGNIPELIIIQLKPYGGFIGLLE